jgi:hypothetical protein
MIVLLLKIELLFEAERIDTTEFYNGTIISSAEQPSTHCNSTIENDTYGCAQRYKLQVVRLPTIRSISWNYIDLTVPQHHASCAQTQGSQVCLKVMAISYLRSSPTVTLQPAKRSTTSSTFGSSEKRTKPGSRRQLSRESGLERPTTFLRMRSSNFKSSSIQSRKTRKYPCRHQPLMLRRRSVVASSNLRACR